MFKESTIEKMSEKFAHAYVNAATHVTAETAPHISDGNSKMGAVASFSVLPFTTCPHDADCKKYCYAARMSNRLTNVLTNYAENTAMVVKFPDETAGKIIEYIVSNGIKWFRFNVSGDMLLKNYMRVVVKVVSACPDTQFLQFTKAYKRFNDIMDVNRRHLLDMFPNWHVIYSDTTADAPAMSDDDNPYNMPRTIVVVNDRDYKEGWKTCGGNCFECACRGTGCWTLKTGETLAFRLH